MLSFQRSCAVLAAVAGIAGPTVGQAAETNSSSSLLAPGAPPPAVATPSGPPGAKSNALGRAPAATPPKASPTPPPEKPANPAAAAVGSGYVFKICNHSSVGALATTYHPSGSGWLIKGWYNVDPGGCSTVGTFPHGWVYFYADAGNGGSWGGNQVKLCAGYPGPFERYDDGSPYTCRDGEELRGFSGSYVGTDNAGFTWNLNP